MDCCVTVAYENVIDVLGDSEILVIKNVCSAVVVVNNAVDAIGVVKEAGIFDTSEALLTGVTDGKVGISVVSYMICFRVSRLGDNVVVFVVFILAVDSDVGAHVAIL